MLLEFFIVFKALIINAIFLKLHKKGFEQFLTGVVFIEKLHHNTDLKWSKTATSIRSHTRFLWSVSAFDDNSLKPLKSDRGLVINNKCNWMCMLKNVQRNFQIGWHWYKRITCLYSPLLSTCYISMYKQPKWFLLWRLQTKCWYFETLKRSYTFTFLVNINDYIG